MFDGMMQLRIALLLFLLTAGLTLALLWRTGVPKAEQFFPVEYYQSRLIVTDDAVELLPPNVDFGYSDHPDPKHRSAIRVISTVEIWYPIPMRSEGRSSTPYHPNYRRPAARDIAKAGPERAVTVRIVASSGGKSYVWPGQPQGSHGSGVADIPEELRARILPVLKADLLDQRGEQWLADAFTVGGLAAPPLPFHRGPRAFLAFVAMIAPAALSFSWFLLTVERRRSSRAKDRRQ